MFPSLTPHAPVNMRNPAEAGCRSSTVQIDPSGVLVVEDEPAFADDGAATEAILGPHH